MDQNKKILLVDDDITSLDIIALLFEKKGFQVTRTASGAQAIESLNSDTPDLAIVDLMMPEMDGVSTVNGLRGSGFTKPVLAFTASGDTSLHTKALEAGCKSIITKPCKIDKLVNIVQTALEEV